MADISQMNVNGTTYDIKDTVARASGVPSGGTTNQVLTKFSSGYGWSDVSGGGGVGTVVNLTTTTASFHNKTVTLTGTYATYSTTFDNAGHASVNVYYVGTYDIACEGFHNSVNVTAMGLVLTQGIDEDYCTVNLSTSDSALEGATCTIYFGDPIDDDVRQVTVVDSTLAFSFRATQIGSYTMISQYGGGSVTTSTTFTVSSLSGSMNVTIQSIPLKTFAAATDEEIALMVQAADAGLIDLYEDCGWRVGQEHQITLGAISSSGTYDGVSWSVRENQPQQTVTLVLVERGGLELVTPVLNKNGTTRTTCSFRYDTKEEMANGGYMNSSSTGSGSEHWQYCSRRNWCNGGFRGALPQLIRSVSKRTKTKRADLSNNLITTNDYFAMYSTKEVIPDLKASDYQLSSEVNALSLISYYSTTTNRNKHPVGDSTNKRWWCSTLYVKHGAQPDDYCCVMPNADTPGSDDATALTNYLVCYGAF